MADQYEGRTATSKDGKTRIVYRNGEWVRDTTYSPPASVVRQKTSSADMKTLQDAQSRSAAAGEILRSYPKAAQAVQAMGTSPGREAFLDLITPDEGDGVAGKIFGSTLGAAARFIVPSEILEARDNLRTINAEVALAGSQQMKGSSSDKDTAIMKTAGISPSKSQAENQRLIRDGIYQAGLDRASAKVTADWIAQYGSLAAPSESGKSYQSIIQDLEDSYAKHFSERQASRKIPKAPPKSVLKKQQAASPAPPSSPSVTEEDGLYDPNFAISDETPRPKPGFFENFRNDIVDNIAPGWGDEIAGTGSAIGALLTGKDAGQAFVKGQRQFRKEQDDYDKENPNASWASTIAGQGIGLLLPASKVLQGANWGRKAIAGALTSAGYGALTGAGEGEGLDLERRGTNAVSGALTGGTVGAVIPGVAPVAQGTGRFLRRNVAGADALYRGASKASKGANRVLAKVPSAVYRKSTGRTPSAISAADEEAYRQAAKAMRRGNIANGQSFSGPPATPQSIADEVARRNEMGVPAMIGDVTEDMRNLTGYASRGMGPGQTMVRERLAKRKAEEANRVRQHVQDNFPRVDDPIEFTEAYSRQMREKAAPLYEEAYRRPMYRTPPIQAIEQTPAFQDALPQAYRNIRNQIDEATGLPKDPSAMGFRYFEGDPNGLPPNSPYFLLPDGGYVAIDRGLSTEGYDQVIRAINDSGRAASNVNPVTGRIESTTNSVHINNRARDLRQNLMEQNGPYRQAVEQYGDDMAYTKAFDQGQDVGKLTGPEIAAQMRNTPDFAREPWSAGAGTALADEASRFGAEHETGDAANHIRKMLGDDAKQRAISEATGNTGGVRNLQERLEFERQGNMNYRGAMQGSQTAPRQAIDDEINASIGRYTSKWAFVQAIMDHMKPRFKTEVQEKLAQIVTASEANTVQEVIAAIEAQAARDADFANLLARAGVRTAGAYGRNLQPTNPTPEGVVQ